LACSLDPAGSLWHDPSVTTEAERQALVLEHYAQVTAIAARFSRRLPGHIDREDVVAWGLLGLLDAIDRYDPERGVPLAALVEVRVRGAIIDNLRQQGLRRSMVEALRMLEQEGPQDPRREQWRLRVAAAATGRLEEEELADEAPSVEEQLERREQRACLRTWIGQLPAGEQKVLGLQLQGLSGREIAARLLLSEGRVSQILGSAEQHLLGLAGHPAGRRTAVRASCRIATN
jgi:RNA polymerase sigma factor FliA